MKVRIINRPTGLLNGQSWPAAGETIDLPKVVADSMAEAGQVEIVAEKRPAPTSQVETRKQAPKGKQAD